MVRLLLVVWILGLGSLEAEARQLRISSFNIEWYGLGAGRSGRETRDRSIRDFVSRSLSRSDVIVFQEIVSVRRFSRRIMSAHRCITYRQRATGHQHVVLCHKKHLRFVRNDDRNFEIEDVASIGGKARPGLHGILLNGKRPIAHVIGVHLKAFPHEVEKRLRQTRVLAKHVARIIDDVPVIVVGDFNSHMAPLNLRRRHDKNLMNDVFDRYGAGLKLIRHNFATYRKEDRRYQLDQFWVSRGVKVRDARVGGPCGKGGSRYSDLEYYNNQVSDHCPVTVVLDL